MSGDRDEVFGTSARSAHELMPDIGALHVADDETYRRAARMSIVDVVTVQAPEYGGAALTIPGTVTLFLARRGSCLLDEVRSAALSDRESVLRLSNRLRRQFEERRQVPLAHAVERLVEQPVFAELRFDDRVVARNLFTPDEETLCVATLPYSGAALDPQAFRLVEYSLPHTEHGLEAVILKYDPALSAMEAAALAAVSADLPNVGPISGPCDADLVEVAFMVLLYVAMSGRSDFASEQHIAEDRIREIGPEATARELMALRREAMKNQ